jgi:ADP-ribose pyrophosphatase
MPDNSLVKPELLSTRLAFDGHLYRVRVDQIRLPSGRETAREVIEHPGAVAILAITEEGQLILVRQYRYAIDTPLLEIPAGTCELDESVVETADRELVEETGYQAAKLTEVRTYFSSAGYSNERITLVIATGCRRVSDELALDEVDEVVLVSQAEARTLFEPGPNEARDAKTIIAVSMLLAGLLPAASPSSS